MPRLSATITMYKPNTAEVKSEKQLYSRIKKARWVLLQNHDKRSEKKAQNLNEILIAHSDLALCYVLKEELIRLFQITDADKTRLPNVTLTVSEIRISFSLIFALVQYLMALLHTNNYEEPILFLTPQNVHASIILSNMSC